MCKNGNIAKRDAQRHCLCVDCKGEAAARRAAWRQRNPDRVKGYSQKWVKANPEKRLETVRSWRDRNPEAVAEMNRKAGAKWSANNKGCRNAINNKRRAALRDRIPPWAELDLIAAVYVEASRLTAESGVPHEVDHIIPLQGKLISGLHVVGNLQILPRGINRSKGMVWQS